MKVKVAMPVDGVCVCKTISSVRCERAGGVSYPNRPAATKSTHSSECVHRRTSNDESKFVTHIRPTYTARAHRGRNRADSDRECAKPHA